MWMVGRPLLASSASEFPCSVFIWECEFRGPEGPAEQRFRFVLRGTTQGPPQETKDLECCGIRDTSQVFVTYVEEGLNEHGLQKDALVPWWYWKATLKTCGVY